jgi:hypothetical protein
MLKVTALEQSNSETTVGRGRRKLEIRSTKSETSSKFKGQNSKQAAFGIYRRPGAVDRLPLAVGSRQLAVGSWQMAVGRWKLEIRSTKLETNSKHKIQRSKFKTSRAASLEILVF